MSKIHDTEVIKSAKTSSGEDVSLVTRMSVPGGWVYAFYIWSDSSAGGLTLSATSTSFVPNPGSPKK